MRHQLFNTKAGIGCRNACSSIGSVSACQVVAPRRHRSRSQRPSRFMLPSTAWTTVSFPPIAVLVVGCPTLPAGAELLGLPLGRESLSALAAVAFRYFPRLGLLPPSRKRAYASTPHLRGACRHPVPSRRHVMSSGAGSWGFCAAWVRRAEYSAALAFANILLTNLVCKAGKRRYRTTRETCLQIHRWDVTLLVGTSA